MQVDVKAVNKMLSNLESTYHSGLIIQSNIMTINAIGDHNGWEGSQGSFNEEETVYSHPEHPGLLMKVTTRTDSYGSGIFTYSIEFGKAVEKVVSVFEEVK